MGNLYKTHLFSIGILVAYAWTMYMYNKKICVGLLCNQKIGFVG